MTPIEEIRAALRELERAALAYHDLACLGGPPVTGAMLAPLKEKLTSAAAGFGIAIDALRLEEGGGVAWGATADAWEALRTRPDDAALKAAYTAADNCIECSCEEGGLNCFYRLDVEDKKVVCIKAAIETYLRRTAP